MNISKLEQRVLHALAQGGVIRHERSEGRKVTRVTCFTREGHVVADCGLEIFKRLRKRGLITSKAGAPYRISRLGRLSVRSQLDNR